MDYNIPQSIVHPFSAQPSRGTPSDHIRHGSPTQQPTPPETETQDESEPHPDPFLTQDPQESAPVRPASIRVDPMITVKKATYDEALLALKVLSERYVTQGEELRHATRHAATLEQRITHLLTDRDTLLSLLMRIERQRNSLHWAWRSHERRLFWGWRLIWWALSPRVRRIERNEYSHTLPPERTQLSA